jgi:hypothetical protein
MLLGDRQNTLTAGGDVLMRERFGGLYARHKGPGPGKERGKDRSADVGLDGEQAWRWVNALE